MISTLMSGYSRSSGASFGTRRLSAAFSVAVMRMVPAGFSRSSLNELIVADLLHPVDALPVEGLRDCDVGHRGGGGRAVPVLLAGRNPDHVAGADLLLRAAVALGPAAAGRDDQRLAERMRMPGRAGAGLEGHDGAGDTRRGAALEGRVDPHGSGEIVGRALGRGLRPAALDH